MFFYLKIMNHFTKLNGSFSMYFFFSFYDCVDFIKERLKLLKLNRNLQAELDMLVLVIVFSTPQKFI